MKRTWWKEATVYQIYPRSFMDSNGDGIGDLKGIISKLDYIKDLGVDVIWLSPVYKSPNDDNGYDISDYYAIMDEFGTMEDWEELLKSVHDRGLRLVMDLVVNHTSDEHPWFVESRSSKDNSYRDYYIWRPPSENGKEPNNWASFFGGSAWKYDKTTGEYFLHLFTKKQPDLNWENPKVRQEVFSMMRWWLDKGVDGFRMDVINLISKHPDLPNMPKQNDEPYQMAFPYFANGPRVYEFLGEMKQKVLDHYDIMTVGETPAVTVEEARKYTNEETGSLNMVFQFEHMDVDAVPGNPYMPTKFKLTELKRTLSRWQTGLNGQGWNSLYFNNHDQPRSVSRFGNDKQFRKESAKMLATVLFCQQGTPYIYQGEEIGMTNVAFPSIDYYRDVATINLYNEYVHNRGSDPKQVLAVVHQRSRDNARTPMQWDDSPNAGFTLGTSWINVNPNYEEINVKEALKDPNSILHYYRKLIAVRKGNDVLLYGDYREILQDDEQLFAYIRAINEDQVLVAANFCEKEIERTIPELKPTSELLLANYPVSDDRIASTFMLRPYEVRVYRL